MTPLQWAVLTAYARTLPLGETRAHIEAHAARAGLTGPRARLGVRLAQASGMLEGERLTEFGRDAARRYLPRLAAKVAP